MFFTISGVIFFFLKLFLSIDREPKMMLTQLSHTKKKRKWSYTINLTLLIFKINNFIWVNASEEVNELYAFQKCEWDSWAKIVFGAGFIGYYTQWLQNSTTVQIYYCDIDRVTNQHRFRVIHFHWGKNSRNEREI